MKETLVLGVLLFSNVAPALAAPCGTTSRYSPQMVAVMVDSLQVLSRDFGSLLGSGPKYDSSLKHFNDAIGRLELATATRLAAASPPTLRAELRLQPKPSGKAGDFDVTGDLEETAEFLSKYVLGVLSDPAHKTVALTQPDIARLSGLIDPVQAILDSELEVARGFSERRLANYERKFGPQSVPLNPIETGLYYALFQRLPGFGPTVDCGPGPWEVVCSYSTVYVTFSKKSVASSSVLEGGFRHYLFGPSWGRGGIGGLLHPAYYSFGLAIAPEQDQVLASPLKGKERYGGFLAWGDLKVAVVGGPHPSMLVSRQLQLVRNVF